MSNSAGNNQGSFLAALLPLVVLYGCAAILVAMSRDDLGGMLQYWEVFVPVVAVISILMGFGNAYARGQSQFFYLIRQLINWGAFIGVLWLLQTQGAAAALGDQKAALTLVYLVAMVSVIIGLQQDWKLLVFGAYLGICAYLLADPANIAILAPIGETFGIAGAESKPMTMIVGMAIAGFVIGAFLLITTRGAMMARRKK